MWERTLSCSSLSKTYSITGWRLGYIIAPPEIIDRAKKVHDFLTVGAAAPLQEAIIPGLNFGQDYYDALQAEYTHKKDLFLKGLDDLKIVHNDPEGAYYVMLDISEFGYESDLQFCEDLQARSAWARCRARASSASRSTTSSACISRRRTRRCSRR